MTSATNSSFESGGSITSSQLLKMGPTDLVSASNGRRMVKPSAGVVSARLRDNISGAYRTIIRLPDSRSQISLIGVETPNRPTTKDPQIITPVHSDCEADESGSTAIELEEILPELPGVLTPEPEKDRRSQFTLSSPLTNSSFNDDSASPEPATPNLETRRDRSFSDRRDSLTNRRSSISLVDSTDSSRSISRSSSSDELLDTPLTGSPLISSLKNSPQIISSRMPPLVESDVEDISSNATRRSSFSLAVMESSSSDLPAPIVVKNLMSEFNASVAFELPTGAKLERESQEVGPQLIESISARRQSLELTPQPSASYVSLAIVPDNNESEPGVKLSIKVLEQASITEQEVVISALGQEKAIEIPPVSGDALSNLVSHPELASIPLAHISSSALSTPSPSIPGLTSESRLGSASLALVDNLARRQSLELVPLSLAARGPVLMTPVHNDSSRHESEENPPVVSSSVRQVRSNLPSSLPNPVTQQMVNMLAPQAQASEIEELPKLIFCHPDDEIYDKDLIEKLKKLKSERERLIKKIDEWNQKDPTPSLLLKRSVALRELKLNRKDFDSLKEADFKRYSPDGIGDARDERIRKIWKDYNERTNERKLRCFEDLCDDIDIVACSIAIQDSIESTEAQQLAALNDRCFYNIKYAREIDKAIRQTKEYQKSKEQQLIDLHNQLENIEKPLKIVENALLNQWKAEEDLKAPIAASRSLKKKMQNLLKQVCDLRKKINKDSITVVYGPYREVALREKHLKNHAYTLKERAEGLELRMVALEARMASLRKELNKPSGSCVIL